MDPDAAPLDHIEALLRRRQAIAAEHAARQFVSARAARAEGFILLGRALQQQGKFAAALRAVEEAEQRAPRHPAARMLVAECLLQCGEHGRGLEELRQLESQSERHPRLLQDIGNLYSHLNRHAEAERCFQRNAALRPEDPQALYNWATCLIALGRLEQAEQVLTRVIALAPADHDAYYNRSTLKRQTTAHNHIDELQRALRRPGLTPSGGIALGFALAKELEDVGRFAESFAALKSAADARRRQLSYRVADDMAVMAGIARSFGGDYCGARTHVAARAARRTVIFIVGLPRSGTTLVDRILSSHSLVDSRGESSDFAASLMHVAGPVADKTALLAKAAVLDTAELGRNYHARLPEGESPYIIDKTPLNFLYLGLIARAFPTARIVHVRRQPYDVCYAMYKTLFRMAYPFSYDLQYLKDYYLAYAALMRHWRAVLGGRMIEVDYEELVAQQESSSRRLLERCGLLWEDACLDFHRNPSPSLTASAAQVRRPIYGSSVGLWRRYERELQPLTDPLRAAGVQ